MARRVAAVTGAVQQGVLNKKFRANLADALVENADRADGG